MSRCPFGRSVCWELAFSYGRMRSHPSLLLLVKGAVTAKVSSALPVPSQVARMPLTSPLEA